VKLWQRLGFPSPQHYAARVRVNKRRIAAIDARLDELGWFAVGGEPEEGNADEVRLLNAEKDRLVDEIAPSPSLDALRQKVQNVTDRETLQVGDWVRCTLPRTAALYGVYARVLDLRRPDQGIQVAFHPQEPHHKPMRMVLSDGHWTPAEDAVTRLGLLTVQNNEG